MASEGCLPKNENATLHTGECRFSLHYVKKPDWYIKARIVTSNLGSPIDMGREVHGRKWMW